MLLITRSGTNNLNISGTNNLNTHIYGDYEHEEHALFVKENYENITIEVIAMLLEIETSISEHLKELENFTHKKTFAKIALLEHAPENIVRAYHDVHGKDWKAFASKHAYKQKT